MGHLPRLITHSGITPLMSTSHQGHQTRFGGFADDLDWEVAPGRGRRGHPGQRKTQKGGAARTLAGRPSSGAVGYLTVTPAPAPSSASLALSAVSLLAFSRTVFGAPSTRSLASLRPRLVSSRTTLMTWIFLSPADSRTTSNSSCSALASSPPPPPPAAGAAATATGAAAVTPKVSSNCFTRSEISISDFSLSASMISSLVRVAMVFSLSQLAD